MDSAVIRRLGAGVGGVLLLVALFTTWAGDKSGWELLTTTDLLYAAAAVAALATALTGGHFGVFRADVSLIGLTDMLNVLATTLLIVYLAAESPADAKGGAYLALAGAVISMFSVGEYRRPPGGWFSRTSPGRPPA